MKKLLIIGLLIFGTFSAKADENPKIDSKVQKVIVFLNGAQVTRIAKVNINPGTSTLIFQNISADIDAQSIQVHANGDFTILSVKNELNFLSEETKQKNINIKNVIKKLNDNKNILSSCCTKIQKIFD